MESVKLMTVDASTLESFEGKNVILHLIKSDGTVEELTGTVESANEHGMAFKPKGKRDFVLVEPKDIEEITEAPQALKSIPQKKLKPIADGSVRQHLLDRHGYQRSVVNGMTDEQAVKLHDEIDHKDLGHRHMSAEEVAKADEKKAAESKDAA